jgi:hypothetical protein
MMTMMTRRSRWWQKGVANERNKKRNMTKMTKKNHSGLPARGICNYTEVGPAAGLHSMRQVMWTLRKASPVPWVGLGPVTEVTTCHLLSLCGRC